MKQAIESVDQYLLQFPEGIQERMRALREHILSQYPDAVEGISYSMPAYKLNKKPFVYFAAYEKHIGVYATPGAQAKMAAALKGYKQGKGSIQFPNDQEFPIVLIIEIIACRASELLR
jgi:uncharacterized protein YdhG (YjbR/CyaY superfamily)